MPALCEEGEKKIFRKEAAKKGRKKKKMEKKRVERALALITHRCSLDVWICGGALGESMVTPQPNPNHTERCIRIRSRVTRAPRSSRELPPEGGQKNNTLSTRPALLLQVKRNCSSDRCLVRVPYLYPFAGGVAGGYFFIGPRFLCSN